MDAGPAGLARRAVGRGGAHDPMSEDQSAGRTARRDERARPRGQARLRARARAARRRRGAVAAGRVPVRRVVVPARPGRGGVAAARRARRGGRCCRCSSRDCGSRARAPRACSAGSATAPRCRRCCASPTTPTRRSRRRPRGVGRHRARSAVRSVDRACRCNRARARPAPPPARRSRRCSTRRCTSASSADAQRRTDERSKTRRRCPTTSSWCAPARTGVEWELLTGPSADTLPGRPGSGRAGAPRMSHAQRSDRAPGRDSYARARRRAIPRAARSAAMPRRVCTRADEFRRARARVAIVGSRAATGYGRAHGGATGARPLRPSASRW